MNRQVTSGINAFVAGLTHIGAVEGFKAPSINHKKLTQSTAAGDSDISTGALESLDMESTFKAVPKMIYEEISKLDDAEIIYKQAYKEGSETKKMEWICVGGINLEYDEFKEGQYVGVKLSQKGLKRYTHRINGKVVTKVDHENVICEVGGKDLLAEVRNAILS